MILKKYFIIFLLTALAIGYNIFMDVLTGLPWNNFIINWNYSLTDPAERATAYILLLFLAVPDILHLVQRKRKQEEQEGYHQSGVKKNAGNHDFSSSGESSPAASQSASGPGSSANSVNKGGNNQGGGQTNVK
ncbi:hypothetical protein [Paenibacillus macerans]|uniref:hypothetical protein n=1 Tax=Paenibacillus macerans TaxID=44252 RepID=UPI003D321DB3